MIPPSATELMQNSAKTLYPGWYQLYFTAVLESDHAQAVLEFSGRKERWKNAGPNWGALLLDNPSERQDLNRAFTYLGMLLDSILNDALPEPFFQSKTSLSCRPSQYPAAQSRHRFHSYRSHSECGVHTLVSTRRE